MTLSSKAPTGSRWGAQKVVGTPSAPLAGGVMGGLHGVLPAGMIAGVPILSKQQVAAQKAAEIQRQIESLKSVLGKK